MGILIANLLINSMSPYQLWQLSHYNNILTDDGILPIASQQEELENGSQSAEDMAAKVNNHYELQLINDEH